MQTAETRARVAAELLGLELEVDKETGEIDLVNPFEAWMFPSWEALERQLMAEIRRKGCRAAFDQCLAEGAR